MELLPGWELVSLTDTEIVQRKQYGTGEVIMRGNPHPDPIERQKCINEIGMIFYKGYLRRRAAEEKNAG